MTALLRKRLVIVWSVAALAAVIVGSVGSAAATPRPPARLPGVPANVSLLFAVEFRSGTLTAAAHAAGKRPFILTLSGIKRMGTWFSDRPVRDAGRVNVARLFRAWRPLGFAAVAPNGAVVLDNAPAKRDAMAVELHLRSFHRRTATATFAVRVLGSLGDGLPMLNRRLGARLASHFTSGALFIDNAIYTPGCTLGQPQLMAVNAWETSRGLTGLLPANGQLLPISSNEALYSIYGTTFGGDGRTTFALPDMAAPTTPLYPGGPGVASGTTWFVCSEGTYPQTASMGTCWPGQINYLIPPGGPTATVTDPNWLPADGRTVAASTVSSYASDYASGASQVTLPNVTAPPGMRAYVCIAPRDTPVFLDLAQVDLFPSTGNPNFLGFGWTWFGAQGETLPMDDYAALFSILGTITAPYNVFTVPNLPAPAPNTAWYIASQGYWPISD